MASVRVFLRRSADAVKVLWSKYDANIPAKTGVAVGKVAALWYRWRENQKVKEELKKQMLEQKKLQERLHALEDEKKNDKAKLLPDSSADEKKNDKAKLLPDSSAHEKKNDKAKLLPGSSAVYPHFHRETIHQMNMQDRHRDAMRGMRRF